MTAGRALSFSQKPLNATVSRGVGKRIETASPMAHEVWSIYIYIYYTHYPLYPIIA